MQSNPIYKYEAYVRTLHACIMPLLNEYTYVLAIYTKYTYIPSRAGYPRALYIAAYCTEAIA